LDPDTRQHGGAITVFTPLAARYDYHRGLWVYVYCSWVFCYAALWKFVTRMPQGTEKKRFGYLLFACPIAFAIAHIGFFNRWGLNFPVVRGMISSLLLYFILLIIAYPQLRELHDFFARSLIIIVNTLAGAAVLGIAFFFSGKTSLSFTGFLMASFLIVISFSPIKVVLKKIFSYFYPESRDVFTSLYEFDEKLEKEKSLLLAEMAPVIAHEIRNPLGSIKGAAQCLRSEVLSNEQKELLNVIVEGTDRLNHVVSQFLDYARPYKISLASQNVNSIVSKAVSIVAANPLSEKIRIVQELDENIPLIEVDEQQIAQVVLNIALNAIESMPKGGILSFYTSHVRSGAGEEILIVIRDTGQGISKKELQDIFKPFFTTKERGVGLGLAISQKIIREHGGSIRVKSSPGQGTEFVIRLPSIEDASVI